MKPFSDQGPTKAFTLLELLVVVAIIILIAFFAIPTNRPKKTARTICQSNLRQDAIALMYWSSDHGDRLPWGVSTNSGGSMEWVESEPAAMQFRPLQSLSEGSFRPQMLICPADPSREAAASVETLENTNLSYFINVAVPGLSASPRPSEVVLMGDRNLNVNGRALTTGLISVSNTSNVEWTSDIHKNGGCFLFLDGHAEFVKTQGLNGIISKQGTSGLRLFVP
jgi:Tfp pilus assembly protein PilE